MIVVGETTISDGRINRRIRTCVVDFWGSALDVSVADGRLVAVGDQVAEGVGVHVTVGVLVGTDVGILVVVAGVVCPGCIVNA